MTTETPIEAGWACEDSLEGEQIAKVRNWILASMGGYKERRDRWWRRDNTEEVDRESRLKGRETVKSVERTPDLERIEQMRRKASDIFRLFQLMRTVIAGRSAVCFSLSAWGMPNVINFDMRNRDGSFPHVSEIDWSNPVFRVWVQAFFDAIKFREEDDATDVVTCLVFLYDLIQTKIDGYTDYAAKPNILGERRVKPTAITKILMDLLEELIGSLINSGKIPHLAGIAVEEQYLKSIDNLSGAICCQSSMLDIAAQLYTFTPAYLRGDIESPDLQAYFKATMIQDDIAINSRISRLRTEWENKYVIRVFGTTTEVSADDKIELGKMKDVLAERLCVRPHELSKVIVLLYSQPSSDCGMWDFA